MIRCSELARVKACPGSVAMCRGLGDVLDVKAPEAEYGTRIHDLIARICYEDDLGQADKAEIEFARTYADAAVKEIDGFLQRDVDKRYWETPIEDASVGLKGTPDLYAVNSSKTTAILVDYKTGWLEQASADRNMQLRGYAVLVSKLFPKLELLRVVLIERNLKITRADYFKADLIKAVAEVTTILGEALKDGHRIAGDHCRYCKANSDCPEAATYSMALAPVVVGQVTKANAKTIAGNLSVQDISTFLSRWGVAQKIAEAIKERAKEMAKNGAEVPWSLKPGAKRATITDATKAFAIMSKVLTPEQFASCCKVQIGELEKMVSDLTGHSIKDARDEVRHSLESVIEWSQNEPSVEMRGVE